MKFAFQRQVYQIQMPMTDLCSLLVHPGFRRLLSQQGQHIKVNLHTPPYCLYIRSEMVPLLQYLGAENPVLKRLQRTLLATGRMS